MAKYSDIKGFTVQTLSSDTAASAAATGSWSSGGSLNQARSSGRAMGGSQTASIFISGEYSAGSNSANVELYDGSSWTETTDVNTARRLGAAAAQTYNEALYMGGYTSTNVTNVESWDGSSWTEVAEFNTLRRSASGAGTNDAGIYIGGLPPGGSSVALNESWNGSSWTEVNDLNNARRNSGSTGISTAALVAGGYGSTYLNKTESWDGTNWTELGNQNTTRAGALGGTYTDALFFGGTTGTTQVTVTEAWDGTSWTEVSDMATARQDLAGSGATSIAALGAGGYTSSMSGATEEFTGSSEFVQIQEGQLFFNSTTNTFKETIKDIPAGTWASVAGLNTGRTDASSAGSATSALMFGGRPSSSPDTNITESWNGSAWTEVNDLNTPRGNSMTGLGLSNSNALSAGGTGPSGPSQRLVNAESWNGSSWTEVNDLNTARNSGGSSGSSTSGLVFGGMTPPYTGKTESWDGTSWTEVNDLNTARYSACVGIGVNNTDAMCVGGFGSTYDDEVETWDGSSWTEVNDLNTAKYGLGASVAGSTSTAIVFGGQKSSSPTITDTETWNGTSWTEQNNLAQARVTPSGSGTNATSALAFGGNGPGTTRYTDTEQWTAPLANKTITAG